MKPRTILFILALGFGLLGKADDTFVPGAVWNTIPQKLIDQGITQVGDFNVIDFQKKAQGIKWGLADTKKLKDIVEGRESALYLVQSKQVYMSRDLAKNDALAQLELHEALGALGYEDRSYPMSTALTLLTQIDAGGRKQKLTQDFGTTIFLNKNITAAVGGNGGGGGSSVGGGGDIIALKVKHDVLMNLLDPKSKLFPGGQVTTEFLENYARVDFEPFYNPKQQYLSVEYQTRPAGSHFQEILGATLDPKTGGHERLSIYIPALLWEQSPESHPEILKQAADDVLSLFPYSSQTPMHLVSAGICPAGGKRFAMPVPRNPNLADLQSILIDFQLNCSATILGARFPDFVDYQGYTTYEPRTTASQRAQQFKITCTTDVSDFEIGTGWLPKNQKGPQAVPIITDDVDNRTNPSTQAIVIFQLYYDGPSSLITQLRITEMQPSKDDVKHPPVDQKVEFAKPVSKASLRMKFLSGGTATITCESKDREI